MILIVVIIYGFISYLIGEFFGRAKHIGRWWTMLLFWSAPIPIIGLLALIFSPTAKQPPVLKRNFIFLGFGIIFFLLSIGFLINIINSSGYVLHFSYIYITLCVIHGIYFTLLGYGKIKNSNPKYYFKDIKIYINRQNGGKFRLNKDTYYFVIFNNEQNGPLNFEELKKLRISSNTLVWRKGLKNWIKAEELDEIESIIVFMPPALYNDELESTETIISDETLIQKSQDIVNFVDVTIPKNEIEVNNNKQKLSAMLKKKKKML
jgi:hypothetical protein